MKVRTIIYGKTFERAKDYLESSVYPKYKDKVISRVDYENFIRFETEDEIVQTLTREQRPSRCHKLFYDVEENQDVLRTTVFPLVNLKPVLENEIIPFKI